jgi:hypothetical protein
MVYAQAQCVVSQKCYFTLELFAAVCEAFSNAYPFRVLNKAVIHQLVTKFHDTWNAPWHSRKSSPIATELIENIVTANWMGQFRHIGDTATVSVQECSGYCVVER